jgi:hypothetical protein
MSVATVFSSRQYEGINRCGIVIVNDALEMAANIFAGAGIVSEPPFFRRIARPGGGLLLLRVRSLTQIAAGDAPTQGLMRG